MARAATSRRQFVAHLAGLAPLVLTAPRSTRALGAYRWRLTGDELEADLIIVGGGLGGCAAALAAATRGVRVILTEATDWIGGQLTAQGVPPDENAWIESTGATRRYLALRAAIRDWYRANTPLTERARSNPHLNPGNCWVSRLGCEPRVALTVLEAMLAPLEANGTLRLLRRHALVAADVASDRVLAVRVIDRDTGRERTLRAPYFIDATELGDLLPLTGTEHVIGAESRAMTGEEHAKERPEPDNQQSFTVCFAVDYRPGEDHTIPRPASYEQWRSRVVASADGTPFPLLSFDAPAERRIGFDPVARRGYWSYRRILDRDQFVPGHLASDVTIINQSQNDYSFGPLVGVSAEDGVRHLTRARELSLSLLHWLQTEAPRADGGAGWPGLRLRPDVLGTTDGLAKHPYIRESRRILAEQTIVEDHVTVEGRMRATGLAGDAVGALEYRDSVGIGHYAMDLHLTTRGDRGQYGETRRFQIPLGALVPRRVENLLPACKNIGTTHLTNGCYRLHPIEWNVGESAGALVAHCLATARSPRGVRARDAWLVDYQRALAQDGVPLAWR